MLWYILNLNRVDEQIKSKQNVSRDDIVVVDGGRCNQEKTPETF